MLTELARSLGALPHRPGAYCFRDARARPLYVGRASDLARRVRSYWRPLHDRPHLRTMVRRARTRDAASERMAFEWAAGVQTRLAALRWLSEAPCAMERAQPPVSALRVASTSFAI